MAQKPDGKAARTERVVFTLSAAERISKVVRIVEAGDRDAGALTFGRPGNSSGGSKVFHVCTFTGAWSKNTDKVVTFINVTSTPNTAVAQNIFVAITGVTETATTKNCAIAKDGTAWYLIAAECS